MSDKFLIPNHNFTKLRKEIGLTQQELSVVLKIKRSLIGAYDEQRAQINIEVIRTLISKGFLLPGQLHDFMFNKDYEPKPMKHYRKARKVVILDENY